MPNIYFFYGLDTYRSFEKFKTWRQAFIEKYGAGTVREISRGETPVKLTEIIGESSLFNPAQLVVVRNPFASGDDDSIIDAEDLLELAKKGTPANTHVLLWQGGNLDKRLTATKKILAADIKVTEFAHMEAGEALQFIAKEAARLGMQIKKDAAELLAKFASTDGLLDSGRALSGLEQLSAYLQDKKVITVEDVLAVVAPSDNEDVFLPLLRAFAARDRARFYKLLYDFGKNSESDQELLGIISALFEQVKTQLQVLDLHEKKYGAAQIDEILDFKKGRARYVLADVQKLNRTDLEALLEKLLEIEYKVKQGQTVILPAMLSIV